MIRPRRARRTAAAIHFRSTLDLQSLDAQWPGCAVYTLRHVLVPGSATPDCLESESVPHGAGNHLRISPPGILRGRWPLSAAYLSCLAHSTMTQCRDGDLTPVWIAKGRVTNRVAMDEGTLRQWTRKSVSRASEIDWKHLLVSKICHGQF